MSENRFEERGYFWWSSTAVPDQRLAPETAVGGTLTVSEDGRVLLELDGRLEEVGGTLRNHDGSVDESLLISGLTKGEARGILLLGLFKRGETWHSSGISHQSFGAEFCIVGTPFRTIYLESPLCTEVECQLDVYNDWFSTGAIKTEWKKSELNISYNQPACKKFEMDDGFAELLFGLETKTDGSFHSHGLSIKETASLSLKFSQAIRLRDVVGLQASLEDFFLLLTNSETGLDWPRVRLQNQNELAQLYYLRRKRVTEAVTRAESWLPYRQIEEEFGNFLRKWRGKRREFGPPYYLYPATRRGVALYQEHKFVNLTTGLESYHRHNYPEVTNGNLDRKIHRLLGQIGAARDRKWLKGVLDRSRGQTLADRLKNLLHALPLNLDARRIEVFSRECAKQRNSLAHFGGSRPGEDYKTFFEAINKLIPALDVLYHLTLLRDLGLDDARTLSLFTDSRQSYRIRHDFRLAGLL